MSRSKTAKKRKSNKFLSVLLFLGLAVIVACAGVFFRVMKTQSDSERAVKTSANTEAQQQSSEEHQREKEDYLTIAAGDEEIPEQVQNMIDKMSLSDKVYQMMFVTPESLTDVGTVVAAGDTTKQALQSRPVGGIIYFAKNLKDRDQTIEMISKTQEYSKIPLFISVDEEGGRVARLGNNPQMGVKKQPPMKTIGDTKDPKKAYTVGEELGIDLKALGFNVDFAPDADVLINGKNTEIGDRSFGTDPKNVALMVENVVKGMQDNGVSATIKHFPGSGSTHVDSHTGRSESTRTLKELRETELVPFQAGINADVDFVMVSHMALVNATKEKVPSSISKEVITDLLLDELGFCGIVITDSFSMGAITEEHTVEEASVMSIVAGADMILMPSDLVKTHDAIVAAVQSGEISEERINQSVAKILTLKIEKKMFQ